MFVGVFVIVGVLVSVKVGVNGSDPPTALLKIVTLEVVNCSTWPSRSDVRRRDCHSADIKGVIKSCR